jgi:phosphatidylglycerol:prolipoprotein diacylglycerol transferase
VALKYLILRCFIYPILGYIGDIAVRSYWVLNIAGIIAGFLVLLYNLKPLPKEYRSRVLLFAVLIFIPFIFASRLGYIIEGLLNHDKDFSLSFFGPVSFWWGFIFAALCCVPFAKLLKTGFWKTADLLSFSIATGGVFAKLGCLFNGCCIGLRAPKNFFFGTFYSPYSYAYTVFGDLPLYPVQLFESFAWLLILIILFIRKKYVVYNGELIILAAFCYSIARFVLEFFRYHEVPHLISGGQLFSILIFIVSSLLWIFKKSVLKKGQL